MGDSYPKNKYAIAIAAMTPAKSASKPQATADVYKRQLIHQVEHIADVHTNAASQALVEVDVRAEAVPVAIEDVYKRQDMYFITYLYGKLRIFNNCCKLIAL